MADVLVQMPPAVLKAARAAGFSAFLGV